MDTDSGTGTAGTSSKTKATKRRYCCVKDCHSREGQPGIRLYRFPGQPWEKERRRKWIVAVRRVNDGDGSAWIPSDAARVCSKHFVNGEKSNIATHPGYYPTIFPDACKSRPVDAGRALSRYERWNRRASAARSAKPENPRTDIDFGDSEATALSTTSSTSSATSSACVNGLDLLCAAAALAQEQTADQACQTDDADTCGRLVGFLCCMDGHDESTQVWHTTICDAGVQCSPSITSRHSGPSQRTSSFNGYESVKSCSSAMRDLCNVTLEMYAVLL